MAKYKASIADLTAAIAACDRLEGALITARRPLASNSKHYKALSQLTWDTRDVNYALHAMRQPLLDAQGEAERAQEYATRNADLLNEPVRS